MAECMNFPATVEEFMEQYKITDTEQVYTNGIELVPIFRMKQWFEHLADTNIGNTDYIRKTDVVNAVPKERIVEYMDEFGAGYNSCRNDMLRSIESIEPADVAPVVYGEWLNAIFDSKRYRCSICNYHISNLVRENYCPNCGAKMDEKE